jgi:hypothetical protein
MRGIAEGSGVRIRSLHLIHSLEPLMTSLDNRWLRPALGACSAVAIRGARSTAGEPILAKNFDYLPLVQPFYTVRESRPRGGLRSLEFTVAALAGAVDGVNEAGLCIALNYAFPADGTAPGPTITMAIAEALGRCTSVSDAATLIAARPRWGAGIVMLADPAGEIASLELSNTRSALRGPRPGEDVLVHTNCFSCDETRDVELPRDAVFSGNVPRVLLGVPVLADHEARARRISELVDGESRLHPRLPRRRHGRPRPGRDPGPREPLRPRPLLEHDGLPPALPQAPRDTGLVLVGLPRQVLGAPAVKPISSRPSHSGRGTGGGPRLGARPPHDRSGLHRRACRWVRKGPGREPPSVRFWRAGNRLSLRPKSCRTMVHGGQPGRDAALGLPAGPLRKGAA